MAQCSRDRRGAATNPALPSPKPRGGIQGKPFAQFSGAISPDDLGPLRRRPQPPLRLAVAPDDVRGCGAGSIHSTQHIMSNFFIIKINNKEYTLRDLDYGVEISTEIGWLTPEQFLNYLVVNEKMNAVLDLAEIGLDRLISGA